MPGWFLCAAICSGVLPPWDRALTYASRDLGSTSRRIAFATLSLPAAAAQCKGFHRPVDLSVEILWKSAPAILSSAKVSSFHLGFLFVSFAR